jgi:transcriptional regulator with XRE-family HTH domain
MKNMFIIKGNICGDRIRLGRAMQKPPLTQDGLAEKIQLLGVTDMSRKIISKIETGERHVIDAELRIIAHALGVSMEWLVGDTENPKRLD